MGCKHSFRRRAAVGVMAEAAVADLRAHQLEWGWTEESTPLQIGRTAVRTAVARRLPIGPTGALMRGLSARVYSARTLGPPTKNSAITHRWLHAFIQLLTICAADTKRRFLPIPS